jgi:predicted RNase H-like nuclease
LIQEIREPYWVGADGCRGGWCAVAIDDGGGFSVDLYPTAADLWRARGNAESVLVDMPLGLLEGPGRRACDEAARTALGPRSSSVFAPPCRQALKARSYDEANAVNRRITGAGLSAQAFNITKKIAEVDSLVRADAGARERIRESHPEVCFAAFARRPMANPKNTQEGFDERREALQQIFNASFAVFAMGLAKLPRSAAKPDDLADALVLAVTAWLGREMLASLPPRPEIDPRGIRMAVWYYRDIMSGMG